MASTGHIAAEIIVVDNGSTDGTRDVLQSCGERIHTLYLDKNHGVAYARNAGMRTANGEYIWILDVDTVVNRDAVDGMIRYLDARPGCGLCACRLQSAAGETQDSCRRLPRPMYKIRNVLSEITGRHTALKHLHEKIRKRNETQFYRRELSGSEPFEAEYVIGACQMFRRTLLDETGYLDDRIFYGPEDADFCLRISRKGYTVVCLPGCSVIHHYNRMSGRKLFSRMSYLHLKGLAYFYFKHIRQWIKY
jgi:GT2 family glycosyltransferase